MKDIIVKPLQEKIANLTSQVDDLKRTVRNQKQEIDSLENKCAKMEREIFRIGNSLKGVMNGCAHFEHQLSWQSGKFTCFFLS